MFSDALADLHKHSGLRMNTYTSRLRQAAGEDVNGFTSRLICSVRQCENGSVPQKKIEEVLIQQLISGVRDSRIRETLLAENSVKLTWERACDLARAKVQVDDQNKLFSTISQSAAISRVKETTGSCLTHSKQRRATGAKIQNHKANYNKCPAINATCRLCNKPGHFARACRSKSVAAVTETLEDVELKECSESEHIFSVHEKNQNLHRKPLNPLFNR
ncbi:hypothetical protein AHF37_07250 [Paragonimus kellicotti]|nr:hypothetical protein AHF37_07250 [Paragonimus kellicotti]